MNLTALSALVLGVIALPLGSAQAAAPAEFALGEAHGGAVSGGAFFYPGLQGHRGTIRRLDLDTGANTVVYMAPNRLTHISDLQAGGDRVAFELVSDGVRLMVMAADGTSIEELARGRDYDRRDCGSVVRLLDVSSSGEVLYDEAAVPCRSRSGRYRVRASDANSRARTLVKLPTDTVFLSMGPPFRKLDGDQFLTWGDRLVRIVDLATGRVRRFRPPNLLTSFAEPDVAADRRVLLTTFRHMGEGRFPRETIRLVSPSGSSRVVHRTRRVFGQARFCGERPVLDTFSPRLRVRLTVVDPLVEVFEGLLYRGDMDSACDARYFVHFTIGMDDGEHAYVHALPD